MADQPGTPTYTLVLVIGLVIVILWKVVGRSLKQRWFAWFYSGFFVSYNELFSDAKTEHFAPLHQMKSLDEECRKAAVLRVLEIGVAEGANFKYYPDNILLYPLDPNRNFEYYFKKNCDKYPNIQVKRYISEWAENMESVPDHSVDVVVSSLVLCTVEDINAVVREVKRVLAPGGKFFFWEHMLDHPGTRLRTIQNIVSFFGFWQFIFDNCKINRAVDEQMEVATKLAGFSSLEQQTFYAPPNNSWILYFVKPHVRGVAIS